MQIVKLGLVSAHVRSCQGLRLYLDVLSRESLFILIRKFTLDAIMDKTDEFPSIIELNAGGSCFTTYLSTLTKEKDSMLAAMFTGRQTITQDKDGRYFLDVDGNVFLHILNFLRQGELPPSNMIKRVKRYAEYFGLDRLVGALESSRVVDIIVGGQHFSVQASVLRKEFDSILATIGTKGNTFPVDQCGRYVIDADGYIFSFVLDFLRFGTLPPPYLACEVRSLAVQLGLKGLANELWSFLPVIQQTLLAYMRLRYSNYPDILNNIIQKISSKVIPNESSTQLTMRCVHADQKASDMCLTCRNDGALIHVVDRDRRGMSILTLIQQDLLQRGFVSEEAIYCRCGNFIDFEAIEPLDIFWSHGDIQRYRSKDTKDYAAPLLFHVKCAAYSYTFKIKAGNHVT